MSFSVGFSILGVGPIEPQLITPPLRTMPKPAVDLRVPMSPERPASQQLPVGRLPPAGSPIDRCLAPVGVHVSLEAALLLIVHVR